jgi:hypothetical protein
MEVLSGCGPYIDLGQQLGGEGETRRADPDDGGIAFADNTDTLAGAEAEFTKALDAAVVIVNGNDFELAVE